VADAEEQVSKLLSKAPFLLSRFARTVKDLEMLFEIRVHNAKVGALNRMKLETK
jgi:hypothetical protein